MLNCYEYMNFIMATQYQDQEFIEYVAKSLVNHSDDVSSTRTVDEMGVLITLKVHPEDMGYIIGREGSTARALRTLLRTVGAKNNARVNLKIFEPEGSRRFERREERSAAPAAEPIDTSAVDNLQI